MAPLGTVWEGVTALRSCRCTASLRVCPLAVEGWAGKVTCRCVQFTEHAQLVHLTNPGLLRTSLALPHNNKDKVVFSTLLSALFQKFQTTFYMWRPHLFHKKLVFMSFQSFVVSTVEVRGGGYLRGGGPWTVRRIWKGISGGHSPAPRCFIWILEAPLRRSR